MPLASTRVDLGIVVLLAALTIAYVAAWPRDFFLADEGLFLYEAKRILSGEVIYRDFFEIITPASLYVMALFFKLFGVSIEVARMSTALQHALIVALMYGTCRALGVGRCLAVAACTAHMAIGYYAVSIASPHWAGTFLTLACLAGVLYRPWLSSTVGCACLGVLAGLLVATQQQKGVIVGIGAGLVVLAWGVIEDRAVHWATIRRALAYSAGILGIVVPMLLLLLLTAGFEPVFNALVRVPLVNYRTYNQTLWGFYGVGVGHHSLPRFTMYLPAIVPLMFARLAWAAVRRAPAARLQQHTALAIMGAAAVASIWYFPNYTHLAIIAPVCLILAAETLDTLLGQRALHLPPGVGTVVGTLLCIGVALQAQSNLRWRRQNWSLSRDTVFGRVDFRNQVEIDLVEAVRARFAGAPTRELFCYSSCPGLYLLTDTINPTPYQLMIPGYNSDEQIAQVINILEARQLHYVAAIPVGVRPPDPILSYLREHYRAVRFTKQPQWAFALFKRKP